MRKHKHYTCCWQLKSSLSSCRQLQTRSTHTLNQSTNVFILFPHDDAHQMTFINDGKSENEPHKTTSATPERANERTNEQTTSPAIVDSLSLSFSFYLSTPIITTGTRVVVVPCSQRLPLYIGMPAIQSKWLQFLTAVSFIFMTPKMDLSTTSSLIGQIRQNRHRYCGGAASNAWGHPAANNNNKANSTSHDRSNGLSELNGSASFNLAQHTIQHYYQADCFAIKFVF